MIETLSFGPEAFHVLGITACGDGTERTAVEGPLKGDHPIALRPALAKVKTARHLDRHLTGLGARVAKKHTVRKGRRDQLLGVAFLRGNAVMIGDLPDLASLISQGFDQARVRMTERCHRDATHQIQISLT